MRKKSKIFIVFATLLVSFNVCAQLRLSNHPNYNFTTPQGSGHSIVSGWNYFEDKQGFIWICSPEGLLRFDGVHTKRYVAKPGDSTSIHNNWVKQMVEIGRNEYLVATKDGLSKFNSTQQIFRRYYLPGETDSIPYRVENLSVFGNSVLVMVVNALYQYNIATGLSEEIPITIQHQNKSLTVKKIYDSSIQDDSIIWLQFKNPLNGLIKYNLLKKQTSFIPFPKNLDPIGIRYDVHGYVWLLSWTNGIDRYNIRNNSFENASKIGFTGKGSDGILIEAERALISSMWGSGLYIYDYKTNTFVIHKLNIERSSSYPGYTTTGPIYKDSKNRYWLSANGKTILLDPMLNQINAFQLPIKDFKIGFKVSDAMPINNMNGIIFNDYDRPLAWYYNLLENKYDNLKTAFIADQLMIDEKLHRITFRNFEYQQVFNYSINKNTGAAVFKSVPKEELSKAESRETIIDTFGNKYYYENGYIKLIKANETESSNLQDYLKIYDRMLNMILSPDKQKIWFGTWNHGIFNYNAKSNILEKFDKKTIPNYMAGNEVGAIAFDGEQNVWWCEMNSGIIIYNPSKKTFKLLSNKEGINITSISQLYYDGKDRMWVQLQNGFHYINTKTLAVRHFNTAEGNEAINTLATLKPVNDSTLLLFCGRYFNLINTNTLDKNLVEPTVNISEVSCNRQAINFLLPAENSFTYNQNNIAIRFSAMEFGLPGNINYQYRLLPDNKNWINVPLGQQEISFEALPPNHYTLNLKASNIKGEFGSKETTYSFTIHPAFWQTWWFKIAVLLLLASLIYAAYKYRLNQFKKLQNIRNNISSNLHDDIGSSLTNIGMLNELAKRSIAHPQKAQGYLEQAADDIQRISENLNDIVWNVNPQLDKANDLLIRMKRYAVDMLEAKNINGTFNFDENHTDVLSMDQRHHLYLIYKEAINNLAKYSQAENATITITTTKKLLIVTISDDGVGFDQSIPSTGNGLKNMESRAKAINADLCIESKTGKGCTIVLTMTL